MRNAVISSSVAGAAILGTDVIGAHANADADSKHARAVPDGDPEEVIHHPGKHKPRRPSHTATHKGTAQIFVTSNVLISKQFRHVSVLVFKIYVEDELLNSNF